MDRNLLPTVVVFGNRVGIVKGETGGGSLFRASMLKSLAQRFETEAFSIGLTEVDCVETCRGPLMTTSFQNMVRVWKMVRKTDGVILSGSWTGLSAWCCLLCRLYGAACINIMTMNSSQAAGINFSGFLWVLVYCLYIASDWLNCLLACSAWTRSYTYLKELRNMGMPVAGVAELNDQYTPFMREDTDEDIHSARLFLSCGQLEKPLLLFAGRIIKEKRIPLLIAARPPGTVLAIVGSGALSDEIMQFHDPANGIVCHVSSIVSQDVLRVYYKAADIHISASTFETLGNTVHESLLCGTAVVVQNAGGYISQVKNGRNGYLVEWENVSEAQGAMDNVLKGKLTSVKPMKDSASSVLTIVDKAIEDPFAGQFKIIYHLTTLLAIPFVLMYLIFCSLCDVLTTVAIHTEDTIDASSNACA